MDLNNIFRKYTENNLSTDQTEISMISQRYNSVSQCLDGITFQAGSYARWTNTKPTNDLDIVNVLWIKNITDYSDDLLTSVYNILDTKESKDKIWYDHLVLQSRSIGIYFNKDESKFSIDIVPAIPTDKVDRFDKTIYQIPQMQKMSKTQRQKFEKAIKEWRTNNEWKLSTPKWYIQYVANLDEQTDKNFRYGSKFIKTWRRWFKKAYEQKWLEFPFKSFHLELINGSITERFQLTDMFDIVFRAFEYMITYIDRKYPYFVDYAYEWEIEKQYVDQYIVDEVDDIFILELKKELNRVISLLFLIQQSESTEEIEKYIEQILRSEVVQANSSNNHVVSNPSKPWAM